MSLICSKSNNSEGEKVCLSIITIHGQGLHAVAHACRPNFWRPRRGKFGKIANFSMEKRETEGKELREGATAQCNQLGSPLRSVQLGNHCAVRPTDWEGHCVVQPTGKATAQSVQITEKATTQSKFQYLLRKFLTTARAGSSACRPSRPTLPMYDNNMLKCENS